MEPDEKFKMLRFAAGKAAAQPFFLAWALEAYMRQERLDREQLARYLGIEPERLPLLGLCRQPESDNSSFQKDVKTICQKFEIPLGPLANLLRRVAAFEAEGNNQTFLMAARDKDEDEDD